MDAITRKLKCCGCGKQLPATEEFFYVRKTGKRAGTERLPCRACWPEYSRRTNARRDAELRKYGITTAEYERIQAQQGGVCAICGGNKGVRRLHVDHCHTTGKVRGLLCSRCNVGLGCFQDNTRQLKAAALYLECNS